MSMSNLLSYIMYNMYTKYVYDYDEDMLKLVFFVALNRPWQLIKTLKTKLCSRRLTQLTAGTPFDETHLDIVRARWTYLTKRFQTSASTKRAPRSDAATFNQSNIYDEAFS